MARRRQARSATQLRLGVEERARDRCEYCRAPQSVCGYRFHLEHVLPTARGGSDDTRNRALACASCNLARADCVAAVDPQTGSTVRLFNPRRQAWDQHFRWGEDRQTLVGLTPTGRATVAALDLNDVLRREARVLWFQTGWLP